MSELSKILLTFSLTVVAGVFVFVAGQIIVKLFIEPIHEQFKIIGEIAYSLIFYANLYSNPGTGKPEKMDEASKALRQQASQLLMKTYAITWYEFWQSVRLVRRHEDVTEASKNLIGLSNSIYQGDPKENRGRQQEIEKRLGIRIYI